MSSRSGEGREGRVAGIDVPGCGEACHPQNSVIPPIEAERIRGNGLTQLHILSIVLQ
jgi:hypothetical protein